MASLMSLFLFIYKYFLTFKTLETAKFLRYFRPRLIFTYSHLNVVLIRTVDKIDVVAVVIVNN